MTSGSAGARQLLIAAPLSFGVFMIGTVLPTMVLIYAILIPRYLKLTGSFTTRPFSLVESPIAAMHIVEMNRLDLITPNIVEKKTPNNLETHTQMLGNLALVGTRSTGDNTNTCPMASSTRTDVFVCANVPY